MNFGIVENNTIINVIVSESIESTQELFPEYEVVEIFNQNMGIGWKKDVDGVFKTEKPNYDSVWADDLGGWLTPEEYERHLEPKTEEQILIELLQKKLNSNN
jgi:hypothetical protein